MMSSATGNSHSMHAATAGQRATATTFAASTVSHRHDVAVSQWYGDWRAPRCSKRYTKSLSPWTPAKGIKMHIRVQVQSHMSLPPSCMHYHAHDGRPTHSGDAVDDMGDREGE